MLSRWLNKRCICPQIVATATNQSLINTMVTNNCGSGAGAKRRFPQFVMLPQDTIAGSSIEYANEVYAQLGLEVKTRAQAGKLGYDILVNEREKKYGFYLYKGKDLTATNNDGNTPCIFSRDFDNVNEQEYTASIENCGNFIYVQGAADDDGSQPVVTVDGEGAAGLELEEVFCDATDIARKYLSGETEVVIPLNTYLAMLRTRGGAELESYGKTINFVSTINTNSNLKFKSEQYIISLNSTYPNGWNASNSRKIGGFHYGRCRKVDANLQPVNGSGVIFGTGWESAVSNGIVPRSVWTLGHRPKCSPEGMVYLGGGTWVDIYLNSDDGAKGLKSAYNCAPATGTEGLNWYNFVERLAKSGKRLPNYAEFVAYAFGSPQGLDNANTNAWTATTNTGRGVTGSVVNAVSAIGCVDAVGRVWELLNDLITRAEHATNADYHATQAWGWDKESPLNMGEKKYDVGNIYQFYAYSLAALVAGGLWGSGANAGARAVCCYYYPWYVYTYIGGRGACDSM